MPTEILRAAIIGAGNIGAQFDSPEDLHLLTHAHAYQIHPGFEIVGFVDPDLQKAKFAADVWGGQAYQSVEAMFAKEKVDVVSVCATTNSHFDILQRLRQTSIQGGILEKPLASTYAEAAQIAADPLFLRDTFLFNFKRRFLPEFQTLRKTLISGSCGDLLSGRVLYGKGLKNNGVHAIDVLLYFGIELNEIVFASAHEQEITEDQSYEVIYKLPSGGFVHLEAVPATNYKVFEFDLLYERGRIHIGDEGRPILQSDIVSDVLFPEYYVPEIARTSPSNADRVMGYVVENLYEVITGSGTPSCTVADGFIAQSACEAILQFSATSHKL